MSGRTMFVAGAVCSLLLERALQWVSEHPHEAERALGQLGKVLLGGLEVLSEHLEENPEVIEFLRETIEATQDPQRQLSPQG